MNNERPFENITPVPNIKVGYFEKEEYLKIIDRQEKQIQSNAWTILALQSRIEILEEYKRPKGEWIIVKDEKWGDNVKCPFCEKELAGTDLNFCCKCGAKLIGSEKMNGGAE